MLWRFPGEDFLTQSQLIVSESEDALFVRDGVILETFSGGKYALSTGNYPFINRLQRMFSGGVSAFNCIFYVNKVHQLELKWGTDSPIQLLDPVIRIKTALVGNGSFTVRVVDSKKFVLKFVGNTECVTTDDIREKFRSAFMQKIKSNIGKFIQNSGKEILGIIANIDEISENLRPVLNLTFTEYGLELVNFFIAAMDIPEDDPSWAQFNAARTTKAQMEYMGNDWERDQNKKIQMAIAQNEASGGVAGLGMALGLGFQAANAAGGMSPIFSPPLPTADSAAVADLSRGEDKNLSQLPNPQSRKLKILQRMRHKFTLNRKILHSLRS